MNLSEARDLSYDYGSACHAVDYKGAKMLSVHAASGRTWAFPWIHFVAVEHRAEPAGETLRLTFSSAEIVIEGTGLLSLFRAVSACCLASVQVLPPERRAGLRNSAPAVERISVHTSEMPKRREDADCSNLK
jgi:hypothetical protein